MTTTSLANGLTDEQFELTMQEFARRLEECCLSVVMQKAKKLRPNYDEKWVLNLKTKLKMIDR
jgi:hypothetical protein